MRRFLKIYFLVLITSYIIPNDKALQKSNFFIRVLLTDAIKERSPLPHFFTINSNDSTTIMIDSHKNKKIVGKDHILSGTVLNGNVYLHNVITQEEICGKRIVIKSQNDKVVLNGIPYRGALVITSNKENGLPMIINILDLDDYLYSVLLGETFQYWPLEMHKVQAVASRSYAMNKILSSRKQGLAYDIKNDNSHQNYGGDHSYSHLREAINATYKTILTFNGQPISAMFDICCGGIVPAKITDKSILHAPYLKRQTRCVYCKNNPQYSWKKSFKLNDFLSQLEEQHTGKFHNFKITKKDKAGLVRHAELCIGDQVIKLSGKKLLGISGIKSLAFDIKVTNPHNSKLCKISFEGTGIGHLIGLCQFGARELISKNWDYKKILKFYYPGVKFAQITEKSCPDSEVI